MCELLKSRVYRLELRFESVDRPSDVPRGLPEISSMRALALPEGLDCGPHFPYTTLEAVSLERRTERVSVGGLCDVHHDGESAGLEVLIGSLVRTCGYARGVASEYRKEG
jgi:hypothetical protein